MVTLCSVGLAAILGWSDILDLIAKPLILVCAGMVIAYTYCAHRIGTISSIDRSGKVFHYSKKSEPVFFYFLSVFYLLLAVPTALYMVLLLADI
jgi:hypothetical protein